MGLFAKPEYQTVLMDYRFKETDGLPELEAYGDVFGQIKYCNILYGVKISAYRMYDDGRYEKLTQDFQRLEGKQKIEVLIKMKKGKPVDFKIDLERLAADIGNADIMYLEVAGWGFNDRPDPEF